MILLKERVRAIQWFFILFSFAGVGLIALDRLNPADTAEEISTLWIGLAILAAVFSGIAYTAIMKLKKTDEPITIVLYFPMIAIPLMIILCFFEFTTPQGIEWVVLLIIGIFTQFAQILMTKALHEGSAATITPFQYFGAIYAFMIGLFIFGETLSLVVNIGIVCVLTGVLLNAVIKSRSSR